jgi:hypothetical protein
MNAGAPNLRGAPRFVRACVAVVPGQRQPWTPNLRKLTVKESASLSLRDSVTVRGGQGEGLTRNGPGSLREGQARVPATVCDIETSYSATFAIFWSFMSAVR